MTRVHKVRKVLLEKKVLQAFPVNKGKEVLGDCQDHPGNKVQEVYKVHQVTRVLKVLKVHKAKGVYKVLRVRLGNEVPKEFRECKEREANQVSKVLQVN